MNLPDLGVGPLDIVLRTAIVYGALVVLLRVGKREVGQLSIVDLVSIMVISNAVQNAMVGSNVTVIGGLIAASTLIALDRALSLVRDRSPRLRRAIDGEPTLLLRDGQPLRDRMHDAGITEDELLLAIRQSGLQRFEDVDLAILEVNGAISVIPRDPDTPTHARSPRPATG